MLRLFAFVVPALFFRCYFLNLEVIQGVLWSIHLWLGSVFMVGIIGFLLSYLVVPPVGAATKDA